MNRLTVVFWGLVAGLLVGCQSFPTKQLSLDVSQSRIPVMLNKNAISEKFQSVSLDAAFSTTSLTLPMGRNVTLTITANQSFEPPLSGQLDQVLAKNPAWIQVSGLYLLTSGHEAYIESDRSYRTSLNLRIPVSGVQK